VQRPLQLREVVQAEERGMDSRDERGERRRRHVADLRQGLQVIVRVLGTGAVMDRVVPQEQPERLSPRVAELRLVDLPEQLALVELQRAGLVPYHLTPRDVQ